HSSLEEDEPGPSALRPHAQHRTAGQASRGTPRLPARGPAPAKWVRMNTEWAGEGQGEFRCTSDHESPLTYSPIQVSGEWRVVSGSISILAMTTQLLSPEAREFTARALLVG